MVGVEETMEAVGEAFPVWLVILWLVSVVLAVVARSLLLCIGLVVLGMVMGGVALGMGEVNEVVRYGLVMVFYGSAAFGVLQMVFGVRSL